jgi:sporulation protein YlmC with PRC-barrel domain
VNVSQRVRFEDLIGKVVHNSYGRAVGKIEDARMEPEGEDYLITHFLIGPLGRLTRLRAFLGELPTLQAIGLGSERDLRPLPWQWFDLSDPDRPVLTTENPAS